MKWFEYCKGREIDALLVVGVWGLYRHDDDWIVANTYTGKFDVYITSKRAMNVLAYYTNLVEFPAKIPFNDYMDVYLSLTFHHTFGQVGIYSGQHFFFVREFETEEVYVCDSMSQAIQKAADLLK